MAEYKTLKGGKIKNYTTDPDNPYVGQLWYNQTTSKIHVQFS